MAHRAKLARANAVFDVLDQAMKAYFDDPSLITIDLVENEHQPWTVWYLTLNRRPDPAFAVLTGDVLHNVRSALDHIVWELADPALRGPHTMYPIAPHSDFDRFDRRGRPVRGSGLHRLLGVPDRAVAIIESTQHGFPNPTGVFAGTPHPLVVLNTLENIDKHRELNMVVAEATAAPLAHSVPPNEELEMLGRRHHTLAVGVAVELARARYTDPSRTGVVMGFEATISFWENVQGFDAMPLLGVLRGLLSAADEILTALETA